MISGPWSARLDNSFFESNQIYLAIERSCLAHKRVIRDITHFMTAGD